MPIVFSYVSEFFSEKQRGPMIIILAACWQPGIIFTGNCFLLREGVEMVVSEVGESCLHVYGTTFIP